jgi:mannose/cellobiose epimerase-like protein (N-acyl-D-glucosamine 2-epimerase family)
VAIFALLDDMSVHDDIARLWAQTEQIKAGVLAAQDHRRRALVDHGRRRRRGPAEIFRRAGEGPVARQAASRRDLRRRGRARQLVLPHRLRDPGAGPAIAAEA